MRRFLTGVLVSVLAATILAWAPRAALAQRSPETRSEAYRVGPGDELEITVAALPDQSRIVTVRDDGGIYVPLFGDISVAGLTVQQLRDRLETRLRGTLKVRTVFVGVRKSAPRTMVVLGDVSRPGPVTLPPGATLVDALALAGGPSPTGGLTDALLVRGKTSRTVNLLPPPPGTPPDRMAAHAGDTLYIHPAPRVTVAGEVGNPSLLTMREGNFGVWAAIMSCGGPKAGAALTRVVLKRANRAEAQVLDLAQGSESPDAAVQLKDGDVLTVSARRVLVFGGGTGGVVSLNENEGLLEFLARAGFKDQHALARVVILRGVNDADGTRRVEKIDIRRFLRTGQPPQNIAPLHDGDIVVVNPPPKVNVWDFILSLLVIRGLTTP